MILYKDLLEEWETTSDANIHLTIDKEVPGWDKHVGFVPQIAEQIAPSPENAVALVCGPPVMISAVLATLGRLGVEPEAIFYDDFGG